MKRITIKHLRGACRVQRALFKRVFPNGAPLTMASAQKAMKAGLDVFWLERLLPLDLKAEYDAKLAPLWKEYDTRRTSLWAEYDVKRTSMWKEYTAKHAPLWAEYIVKLAPLWDEHDATCTSMWKEYDAKCASLLIVQLAKMGDEG